MKKQDPAINEHRLELSIGNLLRGGVIAAASLVILGGVIYLFRRGLVVPDYKIFHGEPEELRNAWSITKYAFSFHGRGLVQLGLLVLIATPVARVVFSIFVFLRQKDKFYVFITCTVLAVLCFSLFGGK